MKGVLLIKQYAPTGADFFIRRYAVRIADIRGNLDSLMKFERLTWRLEAIHEIAFLGFLTWSVWRSATLAQNHEVDRFGGSQHDADAIIIGVADRSEALNKAMGELTTAGRLVAHGQ